MTTTREPCQGYADIWTQRIEATTAVFVLGFLVAALGFGKIEFGVVAIIVMLFGRHLIEVYRVPCTCNGQEPH